ncbi:MAG: peptidoglycan-N-acetylglucosamine deacetylase [Solirubrobacteraceae bacterium]|nr:peptidoglycan-N-acetylglucosamine deacetylase [Solirubrobacteraceae bacterium]
MSVQTPHRSLSPHPRAVYQRRRAAAGLALLALVLLVVLLFALLGGGGGDGKLHLSAENRAALRNVEPVRQGLDRLLLNAPLPSTAEQQAAVNRLTTLGLPVFCAGTQNKYVALTFDDGPGPQTEQVLRLLARHGQRATFFVVGRQLADYPQLPAVEARAGTVGDHTFNHLDVSRATPAVRNFEMARTRDLLQVATGTPITLFRPPYGARDANVDAQARELGLLQTTWNVDTQDSEGASAAGIQQRATEGMRPGAIILMHENKSETLVALPHILRTLERRGYRSVTLPELLALNPPSDQQVQAGFQGCVDAEHPSKAFTPTGSG